MGKFLSPSPDHSGSVYKVPSLIHKKKSSSATVWKTTGENLADVTILLFTKTPDTWPDTAIRD